MYSQHMQTQKSNWRSSVKSTSIRKREGLGKFIHTLSRKQQLQWWNHAGPRAVVGVERERGSKEKKKRRVGDEARGNSKRKVVRA